MKRIEIKASSFRRWVAPPLLLVVTLCFIVLVIDEWSVIDVVFAVMLSIMTLANLDYALSTRLIIDNHGIWFREPGLSSNLVLFAWDEIESVTAIPFILPVTKSLVIELRDSKVFKRRLSFLSRFYLVTRKLMTRHEFWIPVLGLDTHPDKVLSLVQEALKKHRGQSQS